MGKFEELQGQGVLGQCLYSIENTALSSIQFLLLLVFFLLSSRRHSAPLMATHDHGGVRRLLLQVKKMWQQQVTRRHTRDHLPNDVIFEILLRLPAKSLLRLKWVCKYWFNLITRDHSFIKMHLHRSTSSDNEILSIISTSQSSISCWNVDYSNTSTCGYHASSELNTALEFEHPKILGSCNGLILLNEYRRKKLCILNPCTKEYRILPNSLNSEVDRPLLVDNYGFSYDHTNNDYKVLRKAYYWACSKQYFEVYTLGTNSWRMTERFELKCTRAFMAETVFLNGFLYWIDHNLPWHIQSFDIDKEQQFHNMPKMPKFVDSWNDMKLEVFEGSLCAVVKIKDQQVYRAEIWVMKDYVVNNNNETLWTKLSTIIDLQDSEFPIKPLRYTRNGEILLWSNHSHLFLCNPKNNDRNTLGRIYPGHDLVKEVYTESLVSLNSGTYTGQERREEQNNNNKTRIAT